MLLGRAHFVFERGICLSDTRIAVVGIIVENPKSVEKMNNILSDYGEYIIGRMGIPHRAKGVNVISVVLDAPNEVISAMSGKLGMLEGINSKTLYSKV